MDYALHTNDSIFIAYVSLAFMNSGDQMHVANERGQSIVS